MCAVLSRSRKATRRQYTKEYETRPPRSSLTCAQESSAYMPSPSAVCKFMLNRMCLCGYRGEPALVMEDGSRYAAIPVVAGARVLSDLRPPQSMAAVRFLCHCGDA